MRILSSPTFSLVCAILNLTFSISSLAEGEIFWAMFTGFFAIFCFNNYLKAK